MKKYSSPKLSSEVIYKLKSVFDSNNWDDEQLFERYCNLFQSFSFEQQSMMLALTKDFFYRPDPGWQFKEISSFLNELHEEDGFQATKICVAPLLNPIESGSKPKSSHGLSKFFESQMVLTHEFSKGKKITIVHAAQSFPSANKINSGPRQLILVDDFIGSGETAESAINYFLGQGINNDKIRVFCLVAQKEGLDKIENLGIKWYCNRVRFKGIKDYSDENIQQVYYNLMDQIERRLKVKPKFRLGYGQSEALVSLIRTPNNTFPVFWLNEEDHSPPFPR